MRNRYLKGVLALIFLAAMFSAAFAEPQNQGGFFEKGFVNQGLFDETTVTPTATATATPTPAPPIVQPAQTPLPTSIADTASQVYQRGAAAVGSLKALENNPQTRQELKQTLDNLRNRVSGLPPQTQSSSTTANLSRASTIAQIEKELFPEEIVAKTEVTVIVMSKPRASLLKTLDRLLMAHKRGAVIKQLFLIGHSNDLSYPSKLEGSSLEAVKNYLQQEDLDPKKREEIWSTVQNLASPSQLLLERIGLEPVPDILRSQDVLRELNVTLSPTWIVSTPKKTIRLEGSFDPAEFLDEQGFLLPELPQESRGGVRFGEPEKLRGAEQLATAFQLAKNQQREQISLPPRVFKHCTRNRIRQILVGPATLASFFMLDFVLYDPDDEVQAKAASIYGGGSIGFPSGQPDRQHPMTPFITTLPIRCLPTRFRYVNDGSSQYMELRQGEMAWKEQ